MPKKQGLKPEERVNLAVNMSDVVVRICMEGVKAQHPNISDEELVEKVRERLLFGKNRREKDGLSLGKL